jgi:hypothetical protein
MTASNCLGSPIGVIGAASYSSASPLNKLEENLPPRLIHHEVPGQES